MKKALYFFLRIFFNNADLPQKNKSDLTTAKVVVSKRCKDPTLEVCCHDFFETAALLCL
jgi:hypothetical protein